MPVACQAFLDNTFWLASTQPDNAGVQRHSIVCKAGWPLADELMTMTALPVEAFIHGWVNDSS